MTKTTRPFAQRRLSGGMPYFLNYNININSHGKNDTTQRCCAHGAFKPFHPPFSHMSFKPPQQGQESGATGRGIGEIAMVLLLSLVSLSPFFLPLIDYLRSNGPRVLHRQWGTTVLCCRAAAATRAVPTQHAGGGKRIYISGRGEEESPNSPS